MICLAVWTQNTNETDRPIDRHNCIVWYNWCCAWLSFSLFRL